VPTLWRTVQSCGLITTVIAWEGIRSKARPQRCSRADFEALLRTIFLVKSTNRKGGDVKHHLCGICDKLGVSTRLQLALLAM
jgi:hypothetical protein